MISERGRKVIHLATVAAPLLAWYLPRPLATVLLGGALLIALLIEFSRTWVRWARYRFLKRTRRLLRAHERKRWTGATYLAAAYFLVFLLFPKPVAVAGMLYSGLGDAAAGMVGKRWGRHRLASGKSWEGFGAALLINFAAGSLVPGISLGVAGFGALAAALLEVAPLPLDDNLRTTLGGAAAVALAASLLS